MHETDQELAGTCDACLRRPAETGNQWALWIGSVLNLLSTINCLISILCKQDMPSLEVSVSTGDWLVQLADSIRLGADTAL